MCFPVVNKDRLIVFKVTSQGAVFLLRAGINQVNPMWLRGVPQGSILVV